MSATTLPVCNHPGCSLPVYDAVLGTCWLHTWGDYL